MSFGNTSKPVEKKEEPKAKGNAPIHTERGKGGIAVSVWANELTKDGKGFTVYSFVPTRAYMDKEKKWQNISSFREKDIPIVIACLQKAWEKSVLKDAPDSETDSE